MDPKIKNWLGLAGLAAMVIVALASVRFVGAYANATDPASRFAVSGDAEVNVVPDIAEFSFGLTTEGGKDVAALQKQNTDKMNAAIDYLKSQGVDKKDIATENYQISPRYQNFSCPPSTREISQPCRPAEIVGYTISQMVRVKVRDFAKTGDLLSGITERGANNVSGISFTIDDMDEARNEARAEAIKEAREKAESLARAGGFRLGRILSIDEGGNQPIPYYREAFGKGAMDAVSVQNAPSIEPGSQDVNVMVTLTYAIK